MFNFKSILGIGAASLLAANAVAQQPQKHHLKFMKTSLRKE